MTDRSQKTLTSTQSRWVWLPLALIAAALVLMLAAPLLIGTRVQSLRQHEGNVIAPALVRVNDLDSPWGRDDVKAVANIGADAVLFPNVESKADVLEALALLDEAGGKHLPIMLMIESPLGVLRAEEIASASERIACLVLATSDLLNQLHGRRTPDRVALLHSLSHVLLAGRAYDRAVVDGISTDLKDMQSFELACRLGRDLGFDGKSLVHPFQLPYCNDAFTPKPYDLAAALEVIDALENANREGRGTVVVNGRLIEGHHVKAARRLLAMADMIKKLEAGQ
jgi:citrate lyase subunit beta/citryl-CoA lyase